MLEIPNFEHGQFETLHLEPSLAFTMGKLSKDFIKEIEELTPEYPVEDRLVGHLYKESHVNPSKKLEDFIIKKAYELEGFTSTAFKRLEGVVDTENLPEPRIHDMWVNWMRKHDFNPPHDHQGLYSFVIWHKIPYNLEDELRHYPKVKAEDARTSMFVFMGDQAQLALPLDKCHEGYMVIFPSTLKHYVAPFYTSDDYRVSFAGNISFKTNSYYKKEPLPQ